MAIPAVNGVQVQTNDALTDEVINKDLKTVRWNGKAVVKGNQGAAGLAFLGILCLAGVIACAVPASRYNIRGLYAPAAVLGVAGIVFIAGAMSLTSVGGSSRRRDQASCTPDECALLTLIGGIFLCCAICDNRRY